MFNLSRIKLWLVAAAGGAGAILLLLLRVFNAGKKSQEADSLVEGKRQENELDSRINSAHHAGNDARVQQPTNDPNDRANRH